MVTAAAVANRGKRWKCVFDRYGCRASFVSEYGWKRHVDTIHIQEFVYRCDIGPCSYVCNRGDTFIRHLHTAHRAELSTSNVETQRRGRSRPRRRATTSARTRTPQWNTVRDRCKVPNREPPRKSSCGRCGLTFQGEDCWVQRTKHQAGCDRPADGSNFEDVELTRWARRVRLIDGTAKGAIHLLPREQSLGIGSRQSHGPLTKAPPESDQWPAPSTQRSVVPMMNAGPLAVAVADNGGRRYSPRGRPPFRRFVWVCTCNSRFEANVPLDDQATIRTLGDMSVVCEEWKRPRIARPQKKGIWLIGCKQLSRYAKQQTQIGPRSPLMRSSCKPKAVAEVSVDDLKSGEGIWSTPNRRRNKNTKCG